MYQSADGTSNVSANMTAVRQGYASAILASKQSRGRLLWYQYWRRGLAADKESSMKLLSFRTLTPLALAIGSAISAAAACGGDDSNQLVTKPKADSSVSTSSGSGGSSGGSGGSSGSGDGQAAKDSTIDNAADAGAADAFDAASLLVMYDGPPSMVINDAGLGCMTPNGLSIRFNPMFSGYDGVNTYQVPTFVPGMDPSMLTWGSTDPSMVDIQPYTGRPGMMLTTKKAGDVNIVAFVTGTSTCGVAPLHIEQYTTDEWQLGSDRYNNGNPLTITMADGAAIDSSGPPTLPDGAPFDAAMFDANSFDANDFCARLMMMNVTNPFENPPAACTNCHGTMSNGMLFGMSLFMDVQHTPEQTGGFSEDDLTNVFVNGTIPPGGYFDNGILDYCVWHQLHTWTDIDTPEKQKGMRSYLRSLTPMQQVGCFDIFTSTTPMCSDGGLGTGTGSE